MKVSNANNAKQLFKKEGQELQDYLAFQRRASRVKAKKGKGSYNRAATRKIDF